jgi:hypothetical protein
MRVLVAKHPAPLRVSCVRCVCARVCVGRAAAAPVTRYLQASVMSSGEVVMASSQLTFGLDSTFSLGTIRRMPKSLVFSLLRAFETPDYQDGVGVRTWLVPPGTSEEDAATSVGVTATGAAVTTAGGVTAAATSRRLEAAPGHGSDLGARPLTASRRLAPVAAGTHDGLVVDVSNSTSRRAKAVSRRLVNVWLPGAGVAGGAPTH